MEENKIFGTVSNPAETISYTVSLKDGEVVDNSTDASQFMQMGKTIAVCFNPENYEDEVELQLGNYEIAVRDGKTYAVLKKPKYPATYGECCEVLSIPPYYNLRYHTYEHGYNELATSNELLAWQGKLNILGKLLICHKAYYKIAGEEMGLDKPWEPDWKDTKSVKYAITLYDNVITKMYLRNENAILVFPTEEMRDVFYKNFKHLIEQCKELL